MKKSICIFLAAVMILSLSACGKKTETVKKDSSVVIIEGTVPANSGAESVMENSAAPVVTPTPIPAPTYAPTPVTPPVQTVRPAPTPTPAPKQVTITKSPTGETVIEGDNALFIAYADNYTGIEWILVSPDGRTVYNWNDVPRAFMGVSTTGQGTTNAYLYNIPMSMNGWVAQAYFTGYGGPVYTNGAVVTVNESDEYFREKAYDARIAAEKAAEYYGYYLSDIQNYVWHQETDTASFEVTYNKDMVNLIVTIEISRSLNMSIPTYLRWYEGNQFMGDYRFDTENPNVWYSLTNTIEEITAGYQNPEKEETDIPEDERAEYICLMFRNMISETVTGEGFSTGELMNFYFDSSSHTGGADVQFSRDDMFYVLSMRVDMSDGGCYPNTMYCYKDGNLVGQFYYTASGRVWQEWESDFFATSSPVTEDMPETETPEMTVE